MLLYNWLQQTVKAKGGAKALLYRDTYLSWRGLIHRVDRRASEFDSIGVRSGDWVGLMLGNVPDFVILSLALSKLNAAPLPLDPTTSTRELEMIMSLTPLRGLITRPRGGDAPLPASPGSKKGSKKKQAPESRRRLQGTLLSCSIYTVDPHPQEEGDDAIAAILCTADSAGDPKPVERTVANLAAEAEHVAEAVQLGGDDRTLLTIPLFHSFGFDVGLVAALKAGAALYLEDDVAANRIIKLVREHKITVLPGGLTLFEEMGRLPSARPLDHKPIRFVSAGGGLTGGQLEAFRKKFGVRPLACFHQTETGTVSLDAKGQAGGTVGKPLSGVEVKILNPKTGKPAATGRKGTLWIRSQAVSSLRFLPEPAADACAPVGGVNEDGWYHTGDIASLDRSGRLRLQGREDDLVRVDGKRVALGEVEGCIESFPKVSAAQARVITDPLGGPMVVARVVFKGKATPDPEEIIDHCARNLSPYKVPRRIEFCKSI
jgi:acyl-CoA synthetase (AMP-forming)/AMP-acid ligase II